jgi:uncharacterized protein YqfA (UPF0365 family)
MKTSTKVKIAEVLVVIGLILFIILGLGLWVAPVWTAIHFAIKFW